ncbi:hypothetical protein UA32_12225 [Photobacterium angustum]|uniref:Uncharacterized protein n=1 Tax=Photobacterium angustum TaxID=661 RepID=A0ABX5GYF8_PHOAN|nr:hypothetical protein [Photobacterium angustum]KJG37720.1 hypothetical protein UA32_12225 [Photobacterium angustum]PSX03946.1 hypothetical protein C0W27_20855 [Photobacterium angustum]
MNNVEKLYKVINEKKTVEDAIYRTAASILIDAIAKNDPQIIKELIGAVQGSNINLADFLISVRDELKSNKYQSGLFYLDEPEFAFNGWSIPTETWNGAQQPVFNIETATELMHLINKRWKKSYHVSRQNDKKCFTVIDLEAKSTTVIYDIEICINDNLICVSPFMKAQWTWHGAFTEKEKAAVFRDEHS